MKFLPTFGVIFVANMMFQLLFFDAFYGSFWFMLAKESLIFALAVYAFIRLDDKIDALEQRIKELEEKKEG